jgi:hypothetical protein
MLWQTHALHKVRQFFARSGNFFEERVAHRLIRNNATKSFD